MKTFSYTTIATNELSATDLRSEAADWPSAECYSIIIYDIHGITPHAEAAQVLYLPSEGRLGIAWGADATWADVDDLESGIDMWLNDGEAWAASGDTRATTGQSRRRSATRLFNPTPPRRTPGWEGDEDACNE